MSKEITRGYTRKLQLENIGGKKYESADFFASYKEIDIPSNSTPEEIKAISDELHRLSRQDIKDSIALFIADQKTAHLAEDPFKD